jgi:hypothetical protein
MANLTKDRVHYICTIHRKIHHSVGVKEDMWRLKTQQELKEK